MAAIKVPVRGAARLAINVLVAIVASHTLLKRLVGGLVREQQRGCGAWCARPPTAGQWRHTNERAQCGESGEAARMQGEQGGRWTHQ